MTARKSNPSATDPARLADQLSFLRRLAKALVRDEHAAEDLVQDVMVASFERAPADDAPLFGWLSRALRNRSSNLWKLAAHRRERERAVARSEASETPLGAAGELEVQSRVLVAVRELPESIRDVVWKRYWHDLGPKAIAAECNVSIDTVKSRLARGRELLRVRLDRDLSSDSKSWSVVLLAALPSPRTAPVLGPALPTLGAIWMGTKLKVAVASAVLVLGALSMTRDSQRQSDASVYTPDVASAARELQPPTERPAPVQRRALLATEVSPVLAEPRAVAVPPVMSRVSFSGRVLDDEGSAVANVDVLLESKRAANEDRERTRTDASGAFAFADAAAGGVATVDDPNWMSIGDSMGGPGRDRIVLVSRRIPLTGQVIDEAGLPVAGASVSTELPLGFRSRFPIVLDHTLTYNANTTADDEGLFEYDDAVRIRGAQLVCHAEGYRSLREPLDTIGAQIVLRLQRVGNQNDIIEGQVVDSYGRPVEDAEVSFGGERSTTDEHGLFHLARLSEEHHYASVRSALGGESRVLSALKPGYLPGRLQVALDNDGMPLWPDGLVLQLGTTPLTIRGVVIDGDGQPIEGALVWLDEVTLFSMEGGGRSEEALLDGITGRRYVDYHTTADGAFEIGGLAPRDYVLAVLDLGNVSIVHTAPIAAGSEAVEIVLDREEDWEIVAGRVGFMDGTPCPNARVLVMTDANDMLLGDVRVRTSNLLLTSTQTDSQGHFRIEGLPKAHAYLEVMGDGIEMTTYDLGLVTDDDHDNLDLVLARRVHVHVSLDDPNFADEFAILGEEDEPLPMRVYRGKPGAAQLRAPLYGGTASDTLSVAEYGRTLVLYREGEEVRRRAIRLSADGVNELEE
jgi:RNA polymerase sigma-70 factor (ECF subfamily)